MSNFWSKKWLQLLEKWSLTRQFTKTSSCLRNIYQLFTKGSGHLHVREVFVSYERLDCIYFCFYPFCHNMISTKMLSMRTRYLGNNIVRVLVLFTFTGNVSKCKYLKFYSLETSSPYFSSGIV